MSERIYIENALNCLKVGGMVECVTSQQQQLDEVTSYVTPCDVQPPSQMRQSELFVNGTNVRNSIARIYHNTGKKSLNEYFF